MGHEVWATGRNADVLANLSKLGIHTIEADLTEEQSFETVLRMSDHQIRRIISGCRDIFLYYGAGTAGY